MDSESEYLSQVIKDLVGSAIVRNLEAKGFTNIITMLIEHKLDLTNVSAVRTSIHG